MRGGREKEGAREYWGQSRAAGEGKEGGMEGGRE